MILEKFVEIAVWPVSMIVVVLGACLIFLAPLQKLIGRMRKAGYGNKTLEFGDEQAPADAQKKQIEKPEADLPTKPPVDSILGAPSAVAAYAAAEQQLITELEKANMAKDLERAWLVRGLTANRIMWMHERIYRLIVGSQLSLVVAANAFPRPNRSKASELFETARQQYPDLYKNFAFDAWLNFPVVQGLVTVETPLTDNSAITITLLGQDFLHYLVANSLTSPKSG